MSGLPDVGDEVVLTRMALRGGAHDTAERAVLAAERRAAANPGYAVAAAVARHARGLLDRDEAALRDAVRLLDGTERPLLLASAREDLARVVAADRPREAIALLDEALLAYGPAGAEHDAARARRRLRELGVRRRRTLGPPGPREGLAGLTPTERAVVRLVAEGRTNQQVATRLFVSPHTVNTHLRNAFTKLGRAVPGRAGPAGRGAGRAQSGLTSSRSRRTRPRPRGSSSQSTAALRACAQSWAEAAPAVSGTSAVLRSSQGAASCRPSATVRAVLSAGATR
jgi:DNA-binding CsgD family transcriptional regulator